MSTDLTPIEEVKVDLNNLTDKIVMGPQAEVLEKLNQFNEYYNCDIGVTRTFRWSPGIYNKVRELLTTYFLGWDKRSNSMYSLFNKIDNNGYMKRNLATKLMKIDQILSQNRQDGLVFQENKEEIKEYIELFLNKLSEFTEYQHENVFISIETNKDVLEMFNKGITRDMEFNITIDVDIPCMNVAVWADDENDVRELGNIPTPYVIRIHINISFIKWFNKFCVSIQNNRDITNIGSMTTTSNGRQIMHGYISNKADTCKMLHPYISNHGRDGRNGVCWGNLQDYLMQYLFNLNTHMFYDMLHRWATRFVVHKSHPFNQINQCFYGHPEGLSNNDLLIMGGTSNPDSCQYTNKLYTYMDSPDEYESDIKFNNYCDISECLLREQCKAYKIVVLEDIKPVKKHNLEQGQRSAPWPSWMAEDENGVWRDTRTDGERTTQYLEENDPEAIQPIPGGDEVIDDGGEIEDRDGEPVDEGFEAFLESIDQSDRIEEEGEAPF